MASDMGVGDVELPYIDIAPADTDTSAVLTVNPPPGAGASYTVAATGDALEAIPNSTDKRQRWTASDPVTYTVAGLWVLHWDVTGTGEGDEDYEAYVVASPVAGGPTWWPGRSRVAAYVPHRTLVRSASGVLNSQDAYAWTFDSTTTPPGLTVDRLIADGAAWVTALITPMHTKSEPLAGLISALWAAIAIERAWPDDDDSLQRANDMEKQLNTMLAALKTSNDEANDGTDDGFDIVYPRWSFPAADPRWDCPTYW